MQTLTKAIGTTDMKWTHVGLGTWMMEKDPKGSMAALRAGIEAGANHVDTAEMYGDGRVEDIVGSAIHAVRAKLYLVSKVLPSHASYKETLSACDRSLKRLRTDHLDVYLLHWRQRRTQIEETFRAFEKLKQDGKIRHWGVSNFDVEDLEEATQLVGPGQITCNQVLYHLDERSVETRVLPWCRANRVTLVAYSPLGQGRVPDHPVLQEVAQAHQTSPAQIALAFLTRDPLVVAIPKSSDAKRTKHNVQAMQIVLNEDEVRQIDRAFPVKPRKHLATT